MYTPEEIKYLQAKEAYYLAEPIMSDEEFDALEKRLKEQKSRVTEIVGYVVSDKKDKKEHLTPMLSLEKLQVNDEDNMPLSDLKKWMNKCPNSEIEMTPKFDGNAISILYKNGVLFHALSRGDGQLGLDKTEKIKHLVPNVIPDKGVVEIRGEVVIDLDTYQRKYHDPSKVSNPRNFVAGLLNRDELEMDQLLDMVFVAYSYTRVINGESEFVESTMQKLHDFGFNSKYPVFMRKFKDINDFSDLYMEFKSYRHGECPFLLDGIVLKFSEEHRAELGNHSHHPEFAIALKFETLTAVTKIMTIDWTVGTTGELSPIANLQPVELLGTMVKKASLYNLGTILKRKLFPGATVSIRKSGEIIPQVMQVLVPSPDEERYLQQYEEIKSELTD